MPIYDKSRFNKVETLQIEARDGETASVYGLPQTTVLSGDLPFDTQLYTVTEGQTFESIADAEYPESGGSTIAWILAMCNPQVFYPLDLKAGDVIYLPPPQWMSVFVFTADNWETTWRSVLT